MQERKRRKLFSLKHMCRGDGKIYAVIEAAPELEGCELLVRSQTGAGCELPAKVVDWRQGNRRVLVLPIVSVTQKCTIEARAGDGEVVASETHTIRRAAARAHSVMNTLRKDATIRQTRDFDDRLGANWCTVEIDRLINGGTREGNVLHGFVKVVGNTPDEVAGDIELRFLGDDGGDIALAHWICMRDGVDAHPANPAAFMRSIQFSVRVKEDAGAITVWALVGGSRPSEGFRTLDPSGYQQTLEAWCELTRTAFSAPGYDRWYRMRHAVGASELALQAATCMEVEPLFSVIVPLYHTPVAFFREMADSVLRQSYAKFELVLVNSTPEDAELSELIERYAASDDRIVRVDLAENKGITENTNAGIRVAKGDFLCFLDHDDVITDDALFRYAHALNRYRDTDLMYSDEDHIDAAGQEYFGPYFKPDWEPDLILGMNYVCHFLCVRKSIVDEMELPTSEFDGSQDHHMVLRVSEKARNIYHERRILYHWRAHPGSTANNVEEKPYAREAGRKAIQSHLDRCGIKGKAVFPERNPRRFEVEYELEEHPLVSIVIPTKDNVEILDRCLRSILERSSYENYEIILVENNSTEPETFDYYEGLGDLDGRIKLVKFDGAFNYSAVNNFGVGFASGDYLLLLNNDTEVITPNWLERLVALCMRDNTGAVGAKLLYPDGTIQHCGVVSMPGGPGHVNMYRDYGDTGYVETTSLRQDVAAVTGACLMTKRTLFDQIGGLDERLAVNYNDIDYCYAVGAAGYLVVLDPGVELYHYESISRGADLSPERRLRWTGERALLMQKWPARFTFPDANSNPNLNQMSGYYRAIFQDWW